MLHAALLLAALAAPPEPTLLTFAKQPPLLEDGKLTEAGQAAIFKTLQEQLKSKQKQVVLEICTGKEQSLSTQAAAWLARIVAGDFRERDGRVIQWVVRERTKKECPNSALIRVVQLPKQLVQVAKVLQAEGKVSAEVPGGKALDIAEGSFVPLRATIKVAQGACQLLLPDDSVVRLSRDTTLSLQSLTSTPKKRKVTLKLIVGEIWARVAKALSGSEWEVTSANAVAGVRGTEFSMVAASNDGTQVSNVYVYEGVVSLKGSRGKPIDLQAGQTGSVSGKNAPARGELVESPYDLRPVSGEHGSPVELTWKSAVDVEYYRVQVATDTEFLNIRYDVRTKQNKLELEIEDGTYFWRVFSVLRESRRSYPSQLFRITVD